MPAYEDYQLLIISIHPPCINVHRWDGGHRGPIIRVLTGPEAQAVFDRWDREALIRTCEATTLAEAEDWGRQDFEAGILAEENPYDQAAQSHHHRAWLVGWSQAHPTDESEEQAMEVAVAAELAQRAAEAEEDEAATLRHS